MDGNEYVVLIEWQVENQQRIIRGLESENADLRNELCLKCGRFKLANEGACGGCKWKKGE